MLWKEYIEGLYKEKKLEGSILEMEDEVEEDELGDMICEKNLTER